MCEIDGLALTTTIRNESIENELLIGVIVVYRNIYFNNPRRVWVHKIFVTVVIESIDLHECVTKLSFRLLSLNYVKSRIFCCWDFCFWFRWLNDLTLNVESFIFRLWLNDEREKQTGKIFIFFVRIDLLISLNLRYQNKCQIRYILWY